MKKVISFILSFLIFLSIIVFGFVLSISFLIREDTLYKISKNIRYLELVDIKAKDGELKSNYDALYLSLENEFSNDIVEKIYESEIPSTILSNLLLNEMHYLFDTGNIQILDEKAIHRIISESLKSTSFSLEEREKVFSIMKSNSYLILNMEKVVRSRIENIPRKDIIRYIMSYPFKVILLCVLIISIIMEFLINKRNYLPYIFVPTIISCVLEIFVALFLLSFIKSRIHEFIFLLIRLFISYFSNILLFIGLSILFISILSLMMNEVVTSRDKITLKPRIKLKNK